MPTPEAHVDDPIELFAAWMERARATEPSLPEAVALATASADGTPTVRMVLLKSWSADGFVLYTNLGSEKAEQLAENPRAELCLHWKSLRRQVRVRGPVEPVSEAQADAYFASRDRASQLGAWASRQSTPLEGRFALEAAVARMTTRFGIGAVPRPAFWSGFRVVPERIEFWRELPFRLHERRRFLREGEGWRSELLYP